MPESSLVSGDSASSVGQQDDTIYLYYATDPFACSMQQNIRLYHATDPITCSMQQTHSLVSCNRQFACRMKRTEAKHDAVVCTPPEALRIYLSLPKVWPMGSRPSSTEHTKGHLR
eukprot:2692087-Pyramimonas_sp.AAC.1